MYKSNSNPFFVDDATDEEFLRGSRRQSSGPTGGGGAYNSSTEDRRRQLMAEIEASEDRQLESTQRALASIYDSERMGITTAEELLVQGDQLDNIERRTDEINTTMGSAQKHINNIRSVFGGIRNFFSRGGTEAPPEEAVAPAPLRQSGLKETVNRVQQERPQNSQVNYGGLRDDTSPTDDLDGQFMAGSRKPPAQVQKTESQQYVKRVTNSKSEVKMDNNLDMMSSGLSRLKGLAMEMGTEMDQQNLQLDRINDKVDGVDDLIQDQNKQLRGILRK